MAQKATESKLGDLEPINADSGLSNQEKQKKTPLKELYSQNNVIAPKASAENPLVSKESEASRVSGTKRPFPESQMSPQQHSPCGNGHLVYVRRKSEAESGKNNHCEAIANRSNSSQPKQLDPQERHQPKPSINESPMQCFPAYATIPTGSLMSMPSVKPSVPVSLGNSNKKTVSEEPQTKPVPPAIISSVQPKVNKLNWEERYVKLQMTLKTLDQANLEDHLQTLRSLSAVELSKRAIELEKRAIQLSLERVKEVHRFRTMDVLGKLTRTPDGPPVHEQKL